jgi:hypothetical protein
MKPWVLTAIKSAQKELDSRMWENEPTQETTEARRITLIKRLRRYHDGETRFIELAEKLDNCRKSAPCCSGGCPHCAWLFQRWFVAASLKPIKQLKNSGIRYGISIVPEFEIALADELLDINVTNLNRTLKRRLKACGITQAITGLDISLNTDRINGEPSVYSIHYYCVTSTEDPKALKAFLLKCFPKSDHIPRPTASTIFRNGPYCRSYAMKPEFQKRTRVKIFKNDRDQRNTNKGKLGAKEATLTALFADQIGLDERLILTGHTTVLSSKTVAIV